MRPPLGLLPLAALYVNRGKVLIPCGCETRPATVAPVGSNRSDSRRRGLVLTQRHSLPAGGLRRFRAGVEPAGSRSKPPPSWMSTEDARIPGFDEIWSRSASEFPGARRRAGSGSGWRPAREPGTVPGWEVGLAPLVPCDRLPSGFSEESGNSGCLSAGSAAPCSRRG